MTARDRLVILVVLAVGAVVAGWMLVVSPKRDQAAALSTQVSSEQSQLDAARTQVAAGAAARAAKAGPFAGLGKLGVKVDVSGDPVESKHPGSG